MARYANKKKKQQEQTVSARAMRNEKARAANAGKTLKTKSNAGHHSTTTSRRNANASQRNTQSEKKTNYINNSKLRRNNQASKTNQSAVTKRAGITNQDYNKLKKTTERVNNLTKGNVRSSLASILKAVTANTGDATAGVKERRDFETQADYEKRIKTNQTQTKKMSDWASKQIDKGQAEIDKGKKNLGKGGQFAADVYGAGLGLGIDALTGPLAPATMFARSAGSSYHEAEKEGASAGQATLYGLASGGLEAATEKMFSVAKPLQKLYGKGAADDLTERVLRKMVGKAESETGKNVAYHGGKTMMAALSEGLEEMVSEGLEPTIANQIYAEAVGKPHETSAKDILYAGAVGGALGGVLGGGGQVVEYGQGTKVQNLYGEDGLKALAKKVMDSADEADSLTATALNEMIDSGQPIAAGQALQLRKAAQKQDSADREQMDIANRAAVQKMKDNHYIDVLRQGKDGMVDLADNTRKIYDSAKKNATEVLKSSNQMQLPEMQADKITSSVASIVTGVADVNDINLFTTSFPEARTIYETVTGEVLPETNGATRDYLFQKVAMNKVDSAEKETQYFVDSMRGLLQQDVASTYDAEGQKAFEYVVDNLRVGNPLQVNDSIVTFEEFYEAGRKGLDYDEVSAMNNPAFRALPEEVRFAAFEAGLQDKNQAGQASIDAALELGQKAKEVRSETKSVASRGKLVYEFADIENKKRFTAKEQRVFRALAKAFNIDIHITDKPDENGHYVDGEVWMSVDADRSLIYVFAHEITHHMEVFAPEEYFKLKELVRSSWETEDMSKAINQKIAHYQAHGKHLTREAALDEILADSTYEMLQDENFVESLCLEERGIAQKLLDAIQAVIKKIRAILMDADRFTPAQNEALLSQLDILKDAEKLWVDGLMKTVENRDAVGMIETGTEVKYQAATYTWANEVERISNYSGTLKNFEYRDVYMGTTPQFLIDMGFPPLPMGMTSKHIYLITNSSGIFTGKGDNYHDLAINELQNLPDLIETPELTIVSPNVKDRVIVFTGDLDAKNRPIMMVISYASKDKFNNVEIITNFANSAYGRSRNSATKIIIDAINNGEILQFENKKSQTLPISSAGYNTLIRMSNSDFTNNILNFKQNVKNNYPTQNEIDKANATVKQQTLERLRNTLPDTTAATAYIKAVEKSIDKEQKFSLKDSTGRELSQQQAEYFAESKVRDDKGNLKTMYHGSPESFEAFDKKKAKSSGYYGRGFYFTDSESHAGQYGNLYEVYLDIRNPIQEDMYNITREQFTSFVEAVAADEDYGIDNYGYDATVDSVVESVYGKDDFAMLMDINASCIGDMVAAVKLFNEVNGTDYDGIFASTETVAFYPEQVKDVNNANPTSDPRMKFSLKESVEDTRDLIAVHNIASSELPKTLALGGFPMPSIAVVKDTQSHEKYGDVSVLFGKETIDPKASKANKVYGGDAWTPVFPSIDYKVNRDASEEIEKHVESIIGRELMRLMRTPLDYDNMSDALNRWSGNISDAYGNSDGLRYAFLKEKGIEIDVPTKESRLGRRDNGFYISLAEKLGEEKIQKIHKDCSGEYRNKDNVSLVVDVFNEYVAEKYKDKPKLADSLSIENDDIGFADFDEMTRGAYKYLNGGVKTEPDVYTLSKSVDEYFEENNVEAEYESWLGNLFSDIIESEGIRNDKDIFTPSGNRRSWDSLHMAVTLENVVKAMKKQTEKGAGIPGFGSPFGAAQRNFKSIDDIRASKDRLQRYNQDEYEEMHSEYADRFTEIAGRFAKKDQFGSTIDAGSALVENIAKSNSKAQLDRNLRGESQWFNYSEDITEDLWELVKDIQSMPTEYFEAKPQRAVGFNEIVSVIVPDDVGDEMLSALEGNGIEYVMYETGNEQDRTDKVNAQAVQNDVKFSLKDDSNISEDDEPPVDIYENMPTEDEVYDYVNLNDEEFADCVPVRDYDFEKNRVRQQTYDELRKQVDRLQNDKRLTKGKALDTKSISEEVNGLVRTLMSLSEAVTKKTDYDLEKIIKVNAKEIFRHIKSGNIEDAAITAYHTAEEVILNLQLVNDDMYHEYKDLRDYLRMTKVTLSEEDQSNIPDFKDFRKSQMGRLRIVNEGGTSVDNMYQELLGMYPGMFDPELTHPADQLQEIAEVRDSLEPYDVMLSAEETEQLIKETAHDILDITALGQPWKSWADRKKEVYDYNIKALKQKHKEAIRDIKKTERDRYDEKLQEQKEKTAEQIAKVRQQRDDKVEAEKQKNRERQQKQRENKQVREYIRKMEKEIKWLSDRLLNPTDDKHLPEGYQGAIAQLLCSIDTQSERSKKLEEKYGVSKKRFKFLELQREYEEIAKNEDNGILLDEEVQANLKELSKTLEGLEISEATPTELEMIYKILRAITHGIRNVNKAFSDNIKQTIEELSNDTINVANGKKKHVDRTGIIGGLDTLLNESMITPRDFFERIGGGINTTFMGIRKGMDQHIDNITKTREFFDELFKPYHKQTKIRKRAKPGSEIEDWRDASTNQTFKLEMGGNITLNVAQRMSLYCLMKRKQAQGHILGSGIIASEVDAISKIKKLSSVKRAIGAKVDLKSIAAQVTLADVEKIIGSLTDEQVQMADKMQVFLNDECSAWGNQTSMKLYGYEKFVEDDYFPIKSADVYLNKNFDARKDNIERIRNFGFTKGTVVKAKNPIMIDDIFSVFADHVNKMSMYNAFAAPIEDFTRVYNFKVRDENGNDVTSTQAVLKEVYGKKVGRYISNFMADLQNNTQTRPEGFTRLVNKTLANYKKATIAGNFRVALQQPTAVIRAFAVMNPKYFLNTDVNIKKNAEDMKAHCQIARWKSWGFSQVDMARDLDDIMMNKEWSNLELVTMQIYGALDTGTWSIIWAAVRKEIQDKHPEVAVDSDQFYELCNERASEVFDKTQVVDSVLHRSQVMRNKDTMAKMLTSFMAEPTRTFNMIRNEYAAALDQYRDGNKGAAAEKMLHATGVFVANALVCAMAAAVADALRGKDLDDDDEPEKWVEHMWNNFKGNVNVLNMLPVVKEVTSYWDGWGGSNMALEGIEALVTSSKALVDKMNGEKEDYTWGQLFRKEAEAIGLVFGVPVKNILREIETFGNLIGIDVFAATEGTETSTAKAKTPKPEKIFDRLSIEDGSRFDNFLNRLGYNLTDAEIAEAEKQSMISDINSDVEGLTGTERQDEIWSMATKGYTTAIEEGDMAKIQQIREVLEATGGDVELFDERVAGRVKTAYKKSIGTESDSSVYKNYLIDHCGYTEAKISNEILAKSDTAKAFQLAACEGNDEEAVKQLAILIDEGLTYEDSNAIWVNRYSAISANDYVTGDLKSPVNGRVTSTFGYRNAPTAGASSYHEGIDIAAPAGTVVGAADGGKVSYAGYNSAKGNYVRISHGNGRYTEYAHLQGFCVEKGQAVYPGQEIGKVGSTGVSTGPHLDFRVKENGTYVDPAPYIGL